MKAVIQEVNTLSDIEEEKSEIKTGNLSLSIFLYRLIAFADAHRSIACFLFVILIFVLIVFIVYSFKYCLQTV